jgi:cholestenol Delta-isomerase
MGSKQDLFGQLWKEYSLSDSRYLTSDTFTVCMEAITAIFWGPVCYWVAYCIATSNPLRFPLQGIVSLGHIYGDILYYSTSMFEFWHKGVQFFRPEPYYFYCYYVLMNAFWIVIPGSESIYLSKC